MPYGHHLLRSKQSNVRLWFGLSRLGFGVLTCLAHVGVLNSVDFHIVISVD